MLLCLDQVVQRVKRSVSVTAHPPPPSPSLASVFCSGAACLRNIDAAAASSISHNNLERSGVKSHGTPAEWGLLCWNNNNNNNNYKNNPAAAGSHQLMWSLEEAQHVDASHSYDLSFSRCGCRVTHLITCFLPPRVNWMDGCVEMLITAGGWLGEEGSKDDLMAGRIIAASLLLSAEAGISARSAEAERRPFWGMNHAASSARVWYQKLPFKQSRKFLGGRAKVAQRAQMRWLAPE